MLDVGDGQLVYWEVSGNPAGKPVVFLHGGPGGGTSPNNRRLFDPAAYRIVLTDQRGCGRSTPHASEPDADLSINTTWHLVDDLERLREHLGIERWQVFGGSWGSTLGLAYAETHPGHVSELILRGVWTLRQRELDWYLGGGAGFVFPERWQEFLDAIPPDQRDGDLLAACNRLLADPDPAVRDAMGVAWSRWEAATVTMEERPELIAAFSEPRYALAFARIELHYAGNRGWLEEGQLIRDAGRLAGIPGVIVQGRYDLATPPVTAWELHRAWPDSELDMIPRAAHAYDDPGILDGLIRATDKFRPA
jgi:proline iminopeptidase